jgi:hypothetical protein
MPAPWHGAGPSSLSGVEGRRRDATAGRLSGIPISPPPDESRPQWSSRRASGAWRAPAVGVDGSRQLLHRCRSEETSMLLLTRRQGTPARMAAPARFPIAAVWTTGSQGGRSLLVGYRASSRSGVRKVSDLAGWRMSSSPVIVDASFAISRLRTDVNTIPSPFAQGLRIDLRCSVRPADVPPGKYCEFAPA